MGELRCAWCGLWVLLRHVLQQGMLHIRPCFTNRALLTLPTLHVEALAERPFATSVQVLECKTGIVRLC
jgi:hypothetical protein